MKYPYIVGKNGVWYPAGTEVPEDNPNTKTENGQNQYTKTEINRMTTAELQELAADIGIENASDTNGGELKKLLIEHFGL